MSELRIDAEEFEETAERNKSKIRILELTEETIRKEPSNVYVLSAGLCLRPKPLNLTMIAKMVIW